MPSIEHSQSQSPIELSHPSAADKRDKKQRLAPSPTLRSILTEANAIAEGLGQQILTSHMLLGFFTCANASRDILESAGLSEDKILSAFPKGAAEPKPSARYSLRKAEKIATAYSHEHIAPIHLLSAFIKNERSIAYEILKQSPLAFKAIRRETIEAISVYNPATDEPMVSIPLVVTGKPEELPAVASPVSALENPRQSYRPQNVEAVLTRCPTPHDLDPERYPWLSKLGRNLSAQAYLGRVDEAFGRDAEMSQMIDVLGKRRANNPCLVGEPGVGKTAIVEGLAVKMVRGDEDVLPLHGKTLIELDMGRIMAGTALRGSFSERLQGLKNDVERAGGSIIVFIDEIHTLMGAGGQGEGPQDAANELKTALARGVFPCIGSTTNDEFKKYIENDPALERRFIKLRVHEPDVHSCIQMLKGTTEAYERHHHVTIDPSALTGAVELSSRYIHDKHLPGKAVDLLDLAMSRAHRFGQHQIDRQSVARVCSDIAQVPLERLLIDDARRLLTMEHILSQHVFGLEDAVTEVCDTIRRNYAGFTAARPLGTFLFAGPKGAGKSHLALTLSRFLFPQHDAPITIDMSDYQSPESINKLIGPPPGYVGYEQGGILANALRKNPHQAIVFDDIDRAHPDAIQPLVQMISEGGYTDPRGKYINCEHALFIMTATCRDVNKRRGVVGFQDVSNAKDAIESELEHLRKRCSADLWAQLDAHVYLHTPKGDVLHAIAKTQLCASLNRLKERRGIEAEPEDSLLSHIVSQCNPQLGGRGVSKVIKEEVETILARAILRDEIRTGDRLTLSHNSHGLLISGGSSYPKTSPPDSPVT